MDRLLINVHSDSYIRQTNGSTDTHSVSTNSDDLKTGATAPLSSEISSSAEVNAETNGRLATELDSQSKELLNSNGFVSLTTEATECVARNSQSNIPSVSVTSFEDALDRVEEWLKSHGVPVGQTPPDCSLVLITDGHKPPRNVLHPEAAYRGLDRDRMSRTPWGFYVDLISCSRNISIKDGQVVEVRQVPWSATPSIIAGFFSGLNLIPGGVAIRLTDGRRSNTAIVAFESILNAQLALVRHQHQLCGALLPDTLTDTPADKSTGKEQPASASPATNSSKPIMLQVYSATSREFIQCAGCEQQPVVEFLNQLTSGEQVVVRVRGLPYTATKKQILDFFLAVQATVLFDCQGIYLVAYPDRRPTGDAFVLFPDDKTATKALTRHKDYLGDRYVELFKASPSEMVQVCHNVSQQTHNSNKSQTNLLDAHARARTTINALGLNTIIPTLNPYLTGEQQLALALKNLRPGLPIQPTVPLNAGVLPSGIFPVTDIHSTLTENPAPDTTLEQLAMLNTLGLNQPGLVPFGLNVPRPVPSLPNMTPVSPTLPGLRTKSTTEPVTKDLTDPTDPDCTFARSWPEQGVSAVLELSCLPLETSRHDMRLYLGPANYCKVYRMLRKEMSETQTTSTWLLSLTDTTAAIHLIRDLVHRTFSVGTTNGVANQFKVFHNVPTFTLYHVSPDKQLEVVPLDDPNLGIPFNRIHNITGSSAQNQSQRQSQVTGQQQIRKPQLQPQQQQQQTQQLINPMQLNPPLSAPPFLTRQDGGLQVALNGFPSAHLVPNGTATISTDPVYNQLLQAFVSQAQLPQIKSPGCTVNTPGALSTSAMSTPVASMNNPSTQLLSNASNPLLQMPAAQLCGLGDLNTFVNNPMVTTSNSLSSVSNSNACLVMITGAPMDASAEELSSLFQPIAHLLSSPPRFTLHQGQPNGTANFLALFNNPLEAQTAALYCPRGSLRNNQYAIGTACLVPPGPTVDVNGTVQYNPSAPNLLFGGPLAMNNSNLFFS
ncbi:unnamed protein product [Echinostoma caproni]|uniref:RRM domain-containing protein n=1 Tax=Echinostoma caproni TaxID=27848 RepID=A0A183AB59_9TREM|nr:unnamed protein product [Echinostoma caproni]